MANLARMYERGAGGLPKSTAMALDWYRRAQAAGAEQAVAALRRLKGGAD